MSLRDLPIFSEQKEIFWFVKSKMISLLKPTIEALHGALVEQREKNVTYDLIQGTLDHKDLESFKKDPKYSKHNIDCFKIKIGEGATFFDIAVEGLKQFKNFKFSWSDTVTLDDGLFDGMVLGQLVRMSLLGPWSYMVCKIIYTLDEVEEDGSAKRYENLLPCSALANLDRFGYAYGTLPLHLESGEARFMIEWNQQDNCVYYETLSFSRPQHLMSKLGYPVARYTQSAFNRDSALALADYVKSQIKHL